MATSTCIFLTILHGSEPPFMQRWMKAAHRAKRVDDMSPRSERELKIGLSSQLIEPMQSNIPLLRIVDQPTMLKARGLSAAAVSSYNPY